MNIVRKIIKVAAKVVIGIFAFYLFLSLILIPLLAPWVAGSQASKLLGQKVKVRSVLFNPFLLRLTVKGLKITDSAKQEIAGFDKFWADVSFISLIQKKYRVESVGLDGLKVNTILTADGKINLLELIPAEPDKPVQVERVSGEAPAQEEAAKPLPVVTIDLISVNNGMVSFRDESVNPPFITSLHDINVRITELSTLAEREAKVTFEARLDKEGVLSANALLKPLASPLVLECAFKLNKYALGVLTPYTGKYVGRTVGSGEFNLGMNYKIANNQLKADHKILVDSFDFGEKVESKDALNLPYGLALAILKDSQNRINISLPVTGDMSKPDFHYFQLMGQVLRKFFFKLISSPISFLGSMVGPEGTSEDLGVINFAPGKADLSATEKEKLNILVKALNDRPKILLKVNGSYDLSADWKVIKIDVFARDFQVLKEESKRAETWVYQELYQRRFGLQALWKLTNSYRISGDIYDEAKINEEIKRSLIEDDVVDKAALKALAEARAKVIYDFVIASGFDAKRVGIGEPKESQGSADFVPLELTLTIFDSPSGSPL